jgi:MarR family transcriptional regulator, organic hydroperoxide resistance regulator
MQTFAKEPRYYICVRTTQAARKLVAYYNRELAPLGLTAQQVMALSILWREENISLGVFASRSGIGKAAAVTMINRLESMGFVLRKEHPTDARRNRIILTEKARRLAPRVMAKANALEKTVEEALGRERLETLLEDLGRISELDL